MREILYEIKKPQEDKDPKKKPWYEDIPDYDKKIYEYIQKLIAIASATRYARMNGVPEEPLDRIWGDSKKDTHDDKEEPFDIRRLFMYEMLSKQHNELANLLLYSMVIDELKKRR